MRGSAVRSLCGASGVRRGGGAGAAAATGSRSIVGGGGLLCASMRSRQKLTDLVGHALATRSRTWSRYGAGVYGPLPSRVAVIA